MTHYYLTLFISLCCTLNIEAQASKLSIEDNSQFKDRLTGLRLGLFADNGVHPGLKFGTSYILGEKEKSRKYFLRFLRKKRGSKLKIIQYLADGNIGFYNHPNNHLGAFIGAGFTRMRTKTRKMRILSWSFDVNYLLRFYNIPTIELDASGAINEIGGAGNNGLMFAVSPSFGKIYGINKGKREWHFYVRSSIQFLKYDYGFFPNASLEIGASLNLFENTLQGQEK